MNKIKCFLTCCLVTVILISSNYLLVNGEDLGGSEYCKSETNLSLTPIRVKTYDNLINLETFPMIINNKSYIPLRKFFETLGFDIVWNGKLKTIECSNDSFIFNISSKENKVIADDMEISLKDPLIIINGITMFSIESIEQLMFGQLIWDEDNRIIDISNFDIEKIEALFKLTNSLFNKEIK